MLVTLEGIDGSGKTTVWESLRAARGDGSGEESVTFTREPTESWLGQAVRRSIDDDDSDPLAELFLFTADHADHLSRVVKPALAEGDVVVSDRFSDSRYAYQGAALEGTITRPMEYVRGIHQPFTVKPDATIYLDVDPETGAARSGVTDKLEQSAFLSRVRANYEELIDLEPGRFVRVDATQPPEAVIEDVEDAFDRILDQQR